MSGGGWLVECSGNILKRVVEEAGRGQRAGQTVAGDGAQEVVDREGESREEG